MTKSPIEFVLAGCHPFVVPGSGGPPHLPLLGATVAWVALIPLLRTIDSVERKRDLIAVAYLSFGLQLAVSVYWLDVPISRFGGLPHIVADHLRNSKSSWLGGAAGSFLALNDG